MLEMTINEKACRGCRLCLDVCPTNCFCFNEETQKSVVAHIGNCIACMSCDYLCTHPRSAAVPGIRQIEKMSAIR